MEYLNHDQRSPNQPEDELDHILDAALAKYAAVDPREGLEERILAHLRAAEGPVQGLAWGSWLATAVTALVIVAVVLAWRSGKTAHPQIANRPGTTTQTTANTQNPLQSETQAVSRGAKAAPGPRPAPTHRSIARDSLAPVMEAYPKLDQFPSPQPLSEQEKILASYVARFHDEALLVARARSEALQMDGEEEMRQAESGSGNNSQAR